MGRKRNDPDRCGACGREPDCFTRAFSHSRFIDGRHHSLICFTCLSVPKRWEHDGDRLICYSEASPYYLHSVQEMMVDGWTKAEAEFAINSVKKLLTDIPKVAQPIGGQHVLGSLIFSDQVELVGWPNSDYSLKF